ncbi:MAG: putative PEP-binding protein, partial [Ruthenibacterium sp.]
EDEDYLEAIHSALKTQALCAEDAVYRAGVQFSDMFKNMESPYMKERAADVTDITACVMNLLTGTQRDPLSGVTQPVVLAAEELLPSQTIQLDKNKIAAFVTKTGALNSHASILARSLGIPSIAALGDAFEQLKSGDLAIADGIEGLILCDPDAATQTAYAAKMQRLEDETLRLHALCGKRAVTKDGFCVALCANIGQPDEVAAALAQGAEGIGLFRSEFLYLGRNDFPSEEVQFEAYQKALTAMAPRRVVIRTLDLGADKQAACLNLPHEENPALGYRAIRICLDRAADLFVPQLRALLRASVYGNLAILFPMIISVQEIRSILSLLASVKKDLRAEHIPYREKTEL